MVAGQYDKNIDDEFDRILEMLKSQKRFAFVRYNDGETNVLMKGKFSCKQWQMQSGSGFTNALAAGLSYRHSDYLIGIPCGCLEAKDKFRAFLYSRYKLDNAELTYASLFSNAMFYRVSSDLVPEIKKYPIILVANSQTNLGHMKMNGFNIEHFIPVPMNAWQNYQEITNKALNYVDQEKPEGRLFIFCAGPVSNIMIHQLHKLAPRNTFIDMGSALDQHFMLKDADRCYQEPFSWKGLARCYWHTQPIGGISCASHGKSKLFRLYLRLKALFLLTLIRNMRAHLKKRVHGLGATK